MQNSGGVVILMQRSFDWEKISFSVGSAEGIESIRGNQSFRPFSEDTIEFLAALSEKLRETTNLHKMPDVATFAFWCRKEHLKQLKEKYKIHGSRRLGRGVSLHFAPSNIPMLFAFTMTAGLLAGNSVIVRLSQKETIQESVFILAMVELLEKDFPQFYERIVLCRYKHEKIITDYLSSLCDVRVIWGADTSVNEIRKSPLPVRAVELPFASRGSAAFFEAEKVLSTEELDMLVQNFYNDTYLNDQNACSSPQIIFWCGNCDQVRKAQERFWETLYQHLTEKKYQIPETFAVQKLDSALMMAVDFEGIQIIRHENRIVRVQVPKLCESMWNYTVPGGFFIESQGNSMKDMKGIFSHYCQTVCVYGKDRGDIMDTLIKWRVSGVDRIVPVGHALDFSLVWDGFNLIESMSRQIDIM